jgi:hypothetical protein
MRTPTRSQLPVLASFIIAAFVVACSTGDTGSLTGYTHGTSSGGGKTNSGGNSNGDGTGDGTGTGTGTGNGNGTGNGGSDGGGSGPIQSDAGGGGSGGHDAGGSGSGSGSGGANDASSAPDTSVPNDGFDAFQHHNLDVVNQYRATLNLVPLVLDTQLCTFAAAGSLQLSNDHSPHQHFIDAENAGTLWNSGFKSSAAENQGDPNGWPSMSKDPTQNEMSQIEDIQKAMFNEGPGTGEAHGHYENMMSTKARRLGVGLLEVNGELYLTNDFSD